jgi:3-hydroxyisobutyrate dehydrogenase
MIAFLGTGMLGSGFVRALLRNGHAVHVWNRTRDKADALVAYGARSFADPADAVVGAERNHLALSDDGAVDDVLEHARASITTDTVIVDHTTTSTAGTRARIERWGSRGVRYVHAPVFMGPQNALDSTGIMLISGTSAVVSPLVPSLTPMTGKLHVVGERPDAAAAFKLLGNLFLMFLTTGLADMFSLAKAMDMSPREAATLFDMFNPGATIGARAERMLDAKFEQPSWGLAMARKDARIMLDEATAANVVLAILPAIAARMDVLIAEGYGGHDWTVLGKDALTKPQRA